MELLGNNLSYLRGCNWQQKLPSYFPKFLTFGPANSGALTCLRYFAHGIPPAAISLFFSFHPFDLFK